MVWTKEIWATVTLLLLVLIHGQDTAASPSPSGSSSTPPIIMDGAQALFIDDRVKNVTNMPVPKSLTYEQCGGESAEAAEQAINDAIYMVKVLLKNDNFLKPEYRGPLEKYMGTDCVDGEVSLNSGKKKAKDWLRLVLENIANIRWAWYDHLQPFYSPSYKVIVFCDGKYPTFNGGWTPTCQSNTFGWSHGDNWQFGSFFWSYAIGFCSEHFYRTFVPLASMERFARTGRVKKTEEESLRLNYGWAALHQFVELWGAISPILVTADDQGSEAVAALARSGGCTHHFRRSFQNADSWAHWINAAYFQIQLGMKPDEFPQPGPLDDSPGDILQKSNCDGSGYCKRMDPNECVKAIAKIDDDATYSAYMTRTHKSKGHLKGCMARFKCSDGLCPPNGVKGSVIKERLNLLAKKEYCGKKGKDNGKCGSIYFSDYTQVTLNECSSCYDDG